MRKGNTHLRGGGKGCTVIDYVIGDEGVRGRIKRMSIGDKMDSDHHR